MASRLRVLALCYMISPVRGTEYAVAWNYVRTMRAHCDITLLYGCAGPHLGDVVDFAVPSFIDRHHDGDVEFRFVRAPWLARWLNTLNRRGILSYSFYLAYRVWHRAALAEAQSILADGTYDIIHYVGPIGYREPGYLWRLPFPYIWGPIGGTTSFPWRLRRALPANGRLRLVARTIGNAIQLRFSRRVSRALRRADFVFTATTENKANFERMKCVSSTYLPENGIQGTISLNEGKFPATPLRIVWIGALEARKGLSLLLEALARLRDVRAVHLDILGDGPLRSELERLAVRLGIDQSVKWHGHVSRADVSELLNRGHLHVVTGLNEGNPTSIWEAMELSVPVMSLDHCGMRDIVHPPYGIKIRVIDVEQVIGDLALELDALIDEPSRLREMARSCATACEPFRIVHRPSILLKAYETAIDNYRRREARL